MITHIGGVSPSFETRRREAETLVFHGGRVKKGIFRDKRVAHITVIFMLESKLLTGGFLRTPKCLL